MASTRSLRSGRLDLTVLMKMYGLTGYDHLKTPEIYAAAGSGSDE